MTCIRAMVFRPISVLCLAWGLGTSVCAHADSRLTRPTADSQRLIIENNNLTAQAFFAAYMSKEVPERRYAEMYLLGVLDATEGRAWCDYRHLKTITLAEVLHSSLRSMDARQRATRAAHVITDILAKQFPCQAGPQ